MKHHDSVRTETDHLRSSDRPFYRDLGAFIREQGCDPRECVLGQVIPLDPGLEEGVIVVPGPRVFEFYAEARGTTASRTYKLGGWHDLTEQWREHGYWRDAVEAALALYEEEHRPKPQLPRRTQG